MIHILNVQLDIVIVVSMIFLSFSLSNYPLLSRQSMRRREYFHNTNINAQKFISLDQANDGYDTCIVGGGIGGLVSACLLAKQGLRVVLLEKNEVVGGRLGSEYCTMDNKNHVDWSITSHDSSKNRTNLLLYRFDIGPSLLLLPNTYKETFQLLDENMEDYVEIKRVLPYYRCYFESKSAMARVDIDALDLLAEQDSWRDDYDGVKKYLKIATDFLNFGLPNVIEERFELKHLFSFIAACVKVFPLRSHISMLNQLIKSQFIRSALSFQNLYVGLSPYNAPSIFSLLQALEYDQGIYYPIGGFFQIKEAFVSIALKLGVDIRPGHEVVEMHYNEEAPSKGTSISQMLVRRRSKDSRSDRESFEEYNISAKKYITNIDTPSSEFYHPESIRDQRAMNGVPSCGVLQYHFALNRTVDELAHHTIFFSNDSKDSWKYIENPDDPSSFDASKINFYVHAPSRSDPKVCPEGHDAITVLVPVLPLLAHLHPNSNQSIEEIGTNEEAIERIRSFIIQRMQDIIQPSDSPDKPRMVIVDHIVGEQVRTPKDWSYSYNLFRGSAFGLRHSLDQLSVFRPRIRHPFISNLYRVGSSTRPGNGVPLVMIGARLTTSALSNDLAAS